MKTKLCFVLVLTLTIAPLAKAMLLPNPNGKTVYDTVLQVN